MWPPQYYVGSVKGPVYPQGVYLTIGRCYYTLINVQNRSLYAS